MMLRSDKSMQQVRRYILVLILCSPLLFVDVKPAFAVSCANVPLSGNYTVGTSCIFPFPNSTAVSGVDGVDTASGNNTATITIGANQSLTLQQNQTIVASSVILTNTGVSINTNVTGAAIMTDPADHIFIGADADADGYPAYSANVVFSLTGTSRRAAMSTATSVYENQYSTPSTGMDCGDGNASAHPGQTTAFTTSFTSSINGAASYDWNCDGTQAQTYPTATYTCSACTNSSGYASTINSSNGYSGSVPACGTAGTYYTVTNATCQNPAQASCTGAYSTSSVTQSCL